MSQTTRLVLDGRDRQIIHDALSTLRAGNDHPWEPDRLLALLIQFMHAAERLGVSVDV